MLATALDSFLNRPASRVTGGWGEDTRVVDTHAGRIRVRDTGAPQGKPGPAIVMAPDGPNVIEHHAEVIKLLAPHARVICFDLPGFGFSAPRAQYGHRLEEGAGAVLAVMDAVGVSEATFAFSCANGFYAIAAAKLAPQRVRHLLLAQTPGFSAMPAWTKRNVPIPLQLPVAGQLLNRAARRKLAHAWYGIAMPAKPERAIFREMADDALKHGSCFCLAGVVQGLSRAKASALTGVKKPATLLWGDADRSHKYTLPESLHELLPRAEIRTLSGCGHFPDLEQPRTYADIALATLD